MDRQQTAVDRAMARIVVLTGVTDRKAKDEIREALAVLFQAGRDAETLEG